MNHLAEIERLKMRIADLEQELRNVIAMSAEEVCHQYCIQKCFHCEVERCGDNMSPMAQKLKAVRAVLDSRRPYYYTPTHEILAALDPIETNRPEQ